MASILVSFLAVLALFLAVGLCSSYRRRGSTHDYLVASRQVHPWLVGFAAAATNSSGFMFIGLIGATVASGLSAMWLMVGWIAGDYVAWRAIHRRLRERSAELDAQSVSSFVAGGEKGGLAVVRSLCALLTIAFLATYAAAQFTAGSKSLEVLFGGGKTWDAAADAPAEETGAAAASAGGTAATPGPTVAGLPVRSAGILIAAGLLMVYCFRGGMRASIWVNTAEALVMIVSVAVLLGVALSQIGGLGALWSRLEALDPKYVDWKPPGLAFGFAAYLLSWIAAGTGVIGQPHIMTIAMTINSGDGMARARRVYFTWYCIFSALCILVGLCCRVLLNDAIQAGFDGEMALPRLAYELLPGVLVGVLLGGLFAATLSTADSQILCSAAALTQDLAPRLGRTYAATRFGVLSMTAAVALVALLGSQSVFALVVLSWSALASSIGPILAVQALRLPVTNGVGAAMILGGLGTALTWRFGLELSSSMYEVLPGMLAGFAIYGIAMLARQLFPASSSLPAPAESPEL